MAQRYRIGQCEIVPSSRSVLVGGLPQRLGGRAFDLLLELVVQRHRVVTKEELYERVWPGVAVEPNNLQVQIWSLRRLLGAHTLTTVARRGYQLTAQVEVMEDAGPQGAELSAMPPLAWALKTHRWVTLPCATPGQGTLLASQATLALAGQFDAGLWRIPAWQEGPPEDLLQLLQRLQGRESLLMITGGMARAEVLETLLHRHPRVHLLTLLPRPLGSAAEHVLNAHGLPAAGLGAARNSAQVLRWRQRVVANTEPALKLA